MRHLLCGLLLMVGAEVWAGDFAVVVSKQSPLAQLDKRDVANIFLAKTHQAGMAKRIVPLELIDQEYQRTFYQEIAGKSLAQINSYWTTLIFTGKGRPPRQVSDETQLIDALMRNPNAITYLPLERITEQMKVVHQLPERDRNVLINPKNKN